VFKFRTQVLVFCHFALARSQPRSQGEDPGNEVGAIEFKNDVGARGVVACHHDQTFEYTRFF